MPNINLEPHFIRIGEFDPSQVRILEPVCHEYDINGQKVSVTRSQGVYLVNGVEKEAFFELPDSFSFGISEVYPLQIPEKERNSSNISGLQMVYNLSSKDTINDLTKNERYVEKLFDCLYQKTWEKMKEECSKPESETNIPAVSYTSCVVARDKNDPARAVKKVFSHPNKEEKGKKVEDISKPKRAYFKLVTYGRGTEMTCKTKIHGPGNKSLNYTQLVPTEKDKKWGTIHPIIKWEGVFWGAHGSKSPVGASVSCKINEFNFIPSRKRELPPMLTNDAPPEEADLSDSDDDGNVNNVDDDGNDSDGEDLFANPVIVSKQEPEDEPKPKKVVKETKKAPKALSAKERRELRKKKSGK